MKTIYDLVDVDDLGATSGSVSPWLMIDDAN